MCIICIDLARSALLPREARRALGEMRANLDAEHVREIEAKIDEAEAASPAPSSTPTPRP